MSNKNPSFVTSVQASPPASSAQSSSNQSSYLCWCKRVAAPKPVGPTRHLLYWKWNGYIYVANTSSNYQYIHCFHFYTSTLDFQLWTSAFQLFKDIWMYTYQITDKWTLTNLKSKVAKYCSQRKRRDLLYNLWKLYLFWIYNLVLDMATETHHSIHSNPFLRHIELGKHLSLDYRFRDKMIKLAQCLSQFIMGYYEKSLDLHTYETLAKIRSLGSAARNAFRLLRFINHLGSLHSTLTGHSLRLDSPLIVKMNFLHNIILVCEVY
jgi:hypothetical protein